MGTCAVARPHARLVENLHGGATSVRISGLFFFGRDRDMMNRMETD
jgi:hypothetical protein